MRLVRNDLLRRLGSRGSGHGGVARRRGLTCRPGDLDAVSEVRAELVRPAVQNVTGHFNRTAGSDRAGRIPGAARVAPGAAPAASERATFALAFASTYAVEPAAAVPFAEAPLGDELADPAGLACRQPVTVMASLGGAAGGLAADCDCDCAPIVAT